MLHFVMYFYFEMSVFKCQKTWWSVGQGSDWNPLVFPPKKCKWRGEKSMSITALWESSVTLGWQVTPTHSTMGQSTPEYEWIKKVNERQPSLSTCVIPSLCLRCLPDFRGELVVCFCHIISPFVSIQMSSHAICHASASTRYLFFLSVSLSLILPPHGPSIKYQHGVLGGRKINGSNVPLKHQWFSDPLQVQEFWQDFIDDLDTVWIHSWITAWETQSLIGEWGCCRTCKPFTAQNKENKDGGRGKKKRGREAKTDTVLKENHKRGGWMFGREKASRFRHYPFSSPTFLALLFLPAYFSEITAQCICQ